MFGILGPVTLTSSDVESGHDLSNYSTLPMSGQPGKIGGPQVLRLFAHGDSGGSTPATVQFVLVQNKRIVFYATATITPTNVPSGSGRVVGKVEFTTQNGEATKEKLDLLGTRGRKVGGKTESIESTTQGAAVWMYALTDDGDWTDLTLEGVIGEVV